MSDTALLKTFATLAVMSGWFAGPADGRIVINEVDCDTVNSPSTDAYEFLELYSTTGTTTDLSGLTVALINGNGEHAYMAYHLDGQVTDAQGYYVIGTPLVTGAWNKGLGNILQNGPDAVALYAGYVTDDAAATTANLLDAIVYGTGDADDAALLAALGQTVQYNEDIPNSLSRLPGEAGGFVLAPPTPGAPNAGAAAPDAIVPEPAGGAIVLACGAAGLLARCAGNRRKPSAR